MLGTFHMMELTCFILMKILCSREICKLAKVIWSWWHSKSRNRLPWPPDLCIFYHITLFLQLHCCWWKKDTDQIGPLVWELCSLTHKTFPKNRKMLCVSLLWANLEIHKYLYISVFLWRFFERVLKKYFCIAVEM